MAKRRWLFRYLGAFFLLCLVSMIPTILSPNPCWGSDSGEELATFSLEADQQALDEVLQQISEATGYEITVDSEHAQLPITVSLKNVTVHEALRRIFGRLSKYMVIDDAAKKISLNIVDSDSKKIGAGQMPDQGTVVRKKIDPMDVEVVPPAEPGGRSFTRREVEAIRARQGKIDPMDREEAPPVNPGEKGFTLREIEAAKSEHKKTMPKQISEVPPEDL
jgi:type II secretory pathway component GspD/PulD (secretin)